MFGKGAGAVVCAHCRAAGARKSCPLCRHTVCAGCARDFSTCSEPVGIELRLGRSARLRAVDAAGRFGLVSRWRGRMRVVDLRERRFLKAPRWMPRYSLVGPGPGGEPQPTVDGRIIHGRHGWRQDGTWYFAGLAIDVLDQSLAAELGVKSGTISVRGFLSPRSLTACPSGRAAWFLGSDEALYLADLVGFTARRYQPLPGKVLQAAAVDLDRGLVAAATWGQVALYRIEDERLRPLGTARVDGDVSWVGLAGTRVAALAQKGVGPISLTVFELDEKKQLRTEVYRRAPGHLSRGPAAIRPDGRLVAVATSDEGIALIDVESGAEDSLLGHSDGVNLVAFVAGGATLITADYDNRVLVRPRAGATYARPIRRLPLARA